MAWKVIEDNKIIHLWRCSDEDCEDQMEAEVSPDWYQQNGTPICGCGCDMEYIETKIETDET